jgi:hypothetical protein
VRRALFGHEERPCNAVSLEQCDEGGLAAMLRLEIAGEEGIAVKLDPAVDEGRNSAEY